MDRETAVKPQPITDRLVDIRDRLQATYERQCRTYGVLSGNGVEGSPQPPVDSVDMLLVAIGTLAADVMQLADDIEMRVGNLGVMESPRDAPRLRNAEAAFPADR